MNEINLLRLILNGGWVIALLAFITFGLTFIFKMPIKKLTSKISDTKYQKLANKVILLIPVLIGFALVLLYSYLFNKTMTFDEIMNTAFYVALIAIGIYALLEGIKKEGSEYNSPEGSKLTNTITSVIEGDRTPQEGLKAISDDIKQDIIEIAESKDEKLVRIINEAADVLDKPPEYIKKVFDNMKKIKIV